MPKLPSFLDVAECSYNIVSGRWKNASMPRNLSIDCLLVTIQYRVVTDGDKGYGVSIALRGKNDSGLVLVSKFAVIFELPQTKIIFYLLAMYVVLKIMIIELLYSALADILF